MSISDIQKRREQREEITKKSKEAALAYVNFLIQLINSEIKNRKAKKPARKQISIVG